MVVIVSQQMGDDVERFESVPVPGVEGFFQIPILDNGDCHYLGPQGCSIHEQAPVMCQAFSCIAAARNLTTRKVAEGFRDGILVPAVMKRGRELLRKRQKR